MDKNITNNRIFFILSFGILLLSIIGILSNYLFQRLSIQNNADYYALKYLDDFNKNMEMEANSFSNLIHIIEEKNLQIVIYLQIEMKYINLHFLCLKI